MKNHYLFFTFALVVIAAGSFLAFKGSPDSTKASVQTTPSGTTRNDAIDSQKQVALASMALADKKLVCRCKCKRASDGKSLCAEEPLGFLGCIDTDYDFDAAIGTDCSKLNGVKCEGFTDVGLLDKDGKLASCELLSPVYATPPEGAETL